VVGQERFDELAKGVATNCLSRQQVLKTLAVSLVVGMLPTFGGKRADAQSRVRW
jgi:sorbitol-specific phosphotransferase system component IIC